jgi:hypothetical protein
LNGPIGDTREKVRKQEALLLGEYDLTVVADPDQPDEYVLVPLDHSAAQELAAGGAAPCGVEIATPGQLPVVQFGVTAATGVRRLVFWWADWSRVAAAQRPHGSAADV